jgi:hypothetical protein
MKPLHGLLNHLLALAADLIIDVIALLTLTAVAQAHARNPARGVLCSAVAL